MSLIQGRAYHGTAHSDHIVYGVAYCAGYARDVINSRDPEWDHRVDGYAWGYDGHQPENLAVALLAQAINPSWCYRPHRFDGRATVLKLYRQFTAEIVANFGDSWEITTEEILAWIKEKENQSTTTPTSVAAS